MVAEFVKFPTNVCADLSVKVGNDGDGLLMMKGLIEAVNRRAAAVEKGINASKT